MKHVACRWVSVVIWAGKVPVGCRYRTYLGGYRTVDSVPIFQNEMQATILSKLIARKFLHIGRSTSNIKFTFTFLIFLKLVKPDTSMHEACGKDCTYLPVPVHSDNPRMIRGFIQCTIQFWCISYQKERALGTALVP
jgi:hypothetical protein